MDVRVERTGGLLRVEITGSMDLGEFLAFIQAMAPQTLQHGDRLVLVNLLGLEADLNLTGHLLLGKHVAEHLPHVSKLASVVPPDKIMARGHSSRA